jgi:hypothetical protein
LVGHSKGALQIGNAIQSLPPERTHALRVVTLGCPIAPDVDGVSYYQYLGLFDALGQLNMWGHWPDRWTPTWHSTNPMLPPAMAAGKYTEDAIPAWPETCGTQTILGGGERAGEDGPGRGDDKNCFILAPTHQPCHRCRQGQALALGPDKHGLGAHQGIERAQGGAGGKGGVFLIGRGALNPGPGWQGTERGGGW